MAFDTHQDTYHNINHKFRSEVIIPCAAITNNVEFFLCKGTKYAIMGDGTKCVIQAYEEAHICELEEDIKRIYKIPAWDFIKRWHKAYPEMYSILFLKLKLTEYGHDDE